jgi:hypothetical protein
MKDLREKAVRGGLVQNHQAMRMKFLGGLERRRWSQDDKARIVEEALAPGAKVTEVASFVHTAPMINGDRKFLTMDAIRASQPFASCCFIILTLRV